MRVISGTAKGRKLKTPKTEIRPLSDRVKEALFNILAQRIEGVVFLDVCAGSGGVGIEALSRGAQMAFFIEQDQRHVRVIKENLEELGFENRAEIYSLDALKALKILSSKGAKFDIMFLGPPYNSPVLEETLKLLGGASLLKPGGLIVAEHSKRQELGREYGSLSQVREERYGDTVLKFYNEKQT